MQFRGTSRQGNGGYTLTRQGNGGYTLIELLFVAVLVAILAAIAVPVYWDYAAEARLAGHAQFAVETLRLARVEAVTRDVPVSLCASTNGANCTGSRWEDGWIVFTDENDAGVIDGADEVVRGVEAYAGGITLQVTFPDGTPAPYVQFNPLMIKIVQCEGCMGGPGDMAGGTWTVRDWGLPHLLAVLGIEDAMADEDDDDDDDDDDDNDDNDDDDDDEADQLLVTLKFCDSDHSGARGRAINVARGGVTRIKEIDCD